MTVEQLKDFLREHHLPVTVIKAELLRRVEGYIDITFFKAELDVQAFQHFYSDSVAAPSFNCLPQGPWEKENFPVIQEQAAKENKGWYTKNCRTGVCLCQCGHL